VFYRYKLLLLGLIIINPISATAVVTVQKCRSHFKSFVYTIQEIYTFRPDHVLKYGLELIVSEFMREYRCNLDCRHYLFFVHCMVENETVPHIALRLVV
jgi:hypothetical protein